MSLSFYGVNFAKYIAHSNWYCVQQKFGHLAKVFRFQSVLVVGTVHLRNLQLKVCLKNTVIHVDV